MFCVDDVIEEILDCIFVFKFVLVFIYIDLNFFYFDLEIIGLGMFYNNKYIFVYEYKCVF